MWLHPAENSRFGARHHQVDPQIRCVHHSPSLPHNTMTRLCATWRQMPVIVPMTSGCHRAANKYRRASHEARYVVIYPCSKSNEQSLRYLHFLRSSTERITLYYKTKLPYHARNEAQNHVSAKTVRNVEIWYTLTQVLHHTLNY